MALTALLNGNSNCNCYSLTPSLSISDVQVVPIEQILDAVCDLRNSVLIDHNHNFLTLCLVFDHCFSSTIRQAQTLMKMPGKRRKYNARFPAVCNQLNPTDCCHQYVIACCHILLGKHFELN